ncbi:MAG: hypothetical protein AAFY10_14910, partial [Pseudomonadota bacterium]
GIVDGSAAVLIGSKEFGEKWGLTPRARIRYTAKIGSDPTINLTGPVPVTEKLMAETALKVSDFDLIEVNEAFSSVVLRFMQAFEADHGKINVNGGAIAMGHPLGATGAIIIGRMNIVRSTDMPRMLRSRRSARPTPSTISTATTVKAKTSVTQKLV